MKTLLFLSAVIGRAPVMAASSVKCSERGSDNCVGYQESGTGGGPKEHCDWDKDNNVCVAKSVLDLPGSESAAYIADQAAGYEWQHGGADPLTATTVNNIYQELTNMLSNMQERQKRFVEQMEVDTAECIAEEAKLQGDLQNARESLSIAQAKYRGAFNEQQALGQQIAAIDLKIQAMGVCVEVAPENANAQAAAFWMTTGGTGTDKKGCRQTGGQPTTFATCTATTDDNANDYDDNCEWAVNRASANMCQKVPSAAGTLAKLLNHILSAIQSEAIKNIILDVKARQESEADWRDANSLVEFNECKVKLKKEQGELFVKTEERNRLVQQRNLALTEMREADTDVIRLEQEVGGLVQDLRGNDGGSTALECKVADGSGAACAESGNHDRVEGGPCGTSGLTEVPKECKFKRPQAYYDQTEDATTSWADTIGLKQHCINEREQNRIVNANIEHEIFTLQEIKRIVIKLLNGKSFVQESSAPISFIQESVQSLQKLLASHAAPNHMHQSRVCTTTAVEGRAQCEDEHCDDDNVPECQWQKVESEHAEITYSIENMPTSKFLHVAGDFDLTRDCIPSAVALTGVNGSPTLSKTAGLTDAAKAVFGSLIENAQAEMDLQELALVQKDAQIAGARKDAIEDSQKALALHREELSFFVADHDKWQATYLEQLKAARNVQKTMCSLKKMIDTAIATAKAKPAPTADQTAAGAGSELASMDVATSTWYIQMTALCTGDEVARLTALVNDNDTLRAQNVAMFNSRILQSIEDLATAKAAMLTAMQERAAINQLYNYAKRSLLDAQTEKTEFSNLCKQQAAAETGVVQSLEPYPEAKETLLCQPIEETGDTHDPASCLAVSLMSENPEEECNKKAGQCVYGGAQKTRQIDRIVWRSAFMYVTTYAGKDTTHTGIKWPSNAAEWAQLSFSEAVATELVALDLSEQVENLALLRTFMTS